MEEGTRRALLEVERKGREGNLEDREGSLRVECGATTLVGGRYLEEASPWTGCCHLTAT